MLRANRGPARAILAVLHVAVLHAVAAYLAFRRRGTVYLSGGFSKDQPLYGVSDIDLNVIVPADRSGPGPSRARALERWRRLCGLVPALGRLVHVSFGEDDALREAASEPALSYGLDDGPGAQRSAYSGQIAKGGTIGLLEGGLYGPLHGWRRVWGPERRPSLAPPDAQRRRVGAWLTIQSWWRWAFAACLDPEAPWVPLMCVKLVSEPARVWIWVSEGERLGTRAEVLARAQALMPDEGEALRAAQELIERLPDSPAPPLAESLRYFARIGARIGARLSQEAVAAGLREVALLGAERELAVGEADRRRVLSAAGPGATGLLALADWRTRTLRDAPDEAFVLAAADPGDPEALATMARAEGGGIYAGLERDGLLVLPAGDWVGGRMRAAQCAATDPVSFALLRGEAAAGFPELRGWSARDCARRAAVEQAPRLLPGAEDEAPPSARLLSAARAALFLESIERGEPALALNAAAIAEALGDRDPSIRGAAQETAGCYLAWRREGGRHPPAEPAPELAAAIGRLIEPGR